MVIECIMFLCIRNVAYHHTIAQCTIAAHLKTRCISSTKSVPQSWHTL